MGSNHRSSDYQSDALPLSYISKAEGERVERSRALTPQLFSRQVPSPIGLTLQGGGERIRTSEGVTPLQHFQCCAFNHSATLPSRARASANDERVIVTDTFAHSTMRRTGALRLSCQASGNPFAPKGKPPVGFEPTPLPLPRVRSTARAMAAFGRGLDPLLIGVRFELTNGKSRIRTCEGRANGFTARLH